MLPPNSWSMLSGVSAPPAAKVYDIPPVVTRRRRHFSLRLRLARRSA